MSKMNDFLAHHGIKGQKWGIRRFQNDDGSLTSAGRARYGKEGSKDGEKLKWDYDSGTKAYKKNEARHLTDEELKRRTNRLTLENNYRDQLKKSKDADARRKLVQKILLDSAMVAAASTTQQVLSKSAMYFIKKKFPSLIG